MLDVRHNATRRSPYSSAQEAIAGVTLAPIPPRTRLSLRLRPAEAIRRGTLAGLAIAIDINRFSRDGDHRAHRLGPDEWLITGSGDETEELTRRIADELAGTVHSLVDVSHRQGGMIVSGPGAAAVLNAGCPLDLDSAAFSVRSTTRTVFGKIEVLLTRTAEDAFEIEAWRSFADYLRGFLHDSARSL